MNPFVSLMCRPVILRNAAKVSLVVGTLLNLINQGERIWAGGEPFWGHLFMNFLVPFCVATYSGARALSGQRGCESTPSKH